VAHARLADAGRAAVVFRPVRWRRIVAAIVVTVVVAGGLAWHYQSQLIGLGVGWYMTRISATEARDGSLDRRRATVAGMHRALLMSPPPDALVPELFDVLTLLGRRMATGDVPFAWGAYVYTGYVRQLIEDRAAGRPARTPDQISAALDDEVRFYSIRRRPGDPGVRVGDLLGTGGDTYTVDEIEQAAREGRNLPLH
jgi:hypothetical protein